MNALQQPKPMTMRAILLSLAVDQAHTFPSRDKAQSAMASAAKLYWINRRFARCDVVVRRVS